MDARNALRRALNSTETIIRDIEPAAFHRATPCSDWDVHALLNHLIGQLWGLQSRLTGSASPNAAKPGALPKDDLVKDDPSPAFKEVTQAVFAAADDSEAMDRQALMVGAITSDVVIHGWDLATATGQKVGFDDELAQYVLDFMGQGITADNRSPAFGPAVSAPENAPAIDRLIAFSGRRSG
jgi:uncharacterized protein (TIGR03086 family)